jgi:tRNA uridine 5-carboxymethylaminomethyl modification enzyme
MFTSRAEHRLFLREDNADLRLCEKAYQVGLVQQRDYELFTNRRSELKRVMEFVQSTGIGEAGLSSKWLIDRDNPGVKIAAIIRRAGLELLDELAVLPHLREVPRGILRRVCIEITYAGYIEREDRAMAASIKLDKVRIPEGVAFRSIAGLSNEVVEKLTRHQPENLGQASRISGVTPAAIQILRIHLAAARGNPCESQIPSS